MTEDDIVSHLLCYGGGGGGGVLLVGLCEMGEQRDSKPLPLHRGGKE